MGETLDIRCKMLAGYLECDPKIVQRYYHSTGASVAIDSSQNDDLKADLEKLHSAKRYIEKALDKLAKLSKLKKQHNYSVARQLMLWRQTCMQIYRMSYFLMRT